MSRTVAGLLLIIAFLNGCASNNSSKEENQASEPVKPLTNLEVLKFAPSNSYFVGVVRPANIMEIDEIKDNPFADLKGNLPFRPSDIDFAMSTIFPHPYAGTGTLLAFRSLKRIDQQEVVARLNPKAKPLVGLENVYSDQSGRRGSLTIGFIDDHTVIASEAMGVVIDQTREVENELKLESNFAEFSSQLDPDSHAFVLVDVEKLRHIGYDSVPETTNDFFTKRKLLKSIRKTLVSLNLSDTKDGVKLFATQVDPIDQPLLQVKAFAKNELTQLVDHLKTATKEGGETVDTIKSQLNSLIDGLAKQDGQNFIVLSTDHFGPLKTTMFVTQIMALQKKIAETNVRNLSCILKFSQLMLAIHQYQDVKQRLPSDITGKDGTPLLSWRVAILPFLNQAGLYSRFKLDEPWDSKHNLAVARDRPDIFEGRLSEVTTDTSVLWVKGPGTGGEKQTIREVNSKIETICLVESTELPHWTKPQDHLFMSDAPKRGLVAKEPIVADYLGRAYPLDLTLADEILKNAFLVDGDRKELDQLDARSSRLDDRVITVGEIYRVSDDEVDKQLETLRSKPDRESILRALFILSQQRPGFFDNRKANILKVIPPFFQHKSPLVRLLALKTVHAWRYNGELSPAIFEPILNESYDANRWAAIKMLGAHQDPKASIQLVRAFATDHSLAFQTIDENLAGRIANDVVTLLKDENVQVVKAAISLIGNYGEERHALILEKFDSGDSTELDEFRNRTVEYIRKPGPLAVALKESGDIYIALEEVANTYRKNEAGKPTALDVGSDEFKHSDFMLVGKALELEHLYLNGSGITANGLKQLQHLPLKSLEIGYNSRISDEIADVIEKFPELTSLTIDSTQIGDKTALKIASLSKLENLSLYNTKITDKGVKALVSLKGLRSLSLSENRITDEAIKEIAKLPKLKFLGVAETGITDASVAHLLKLDLEELRFRYTRISEAGAAQLRRRFSK